jgi:hypothetical protein
MREEGLVEGGRLCENEASEKDIKNVTKEITKRQERNLRNNV